MISLAQPFIPFSSRNSVELCLNSGWVSGGGKYVGEFEAEIANACNVKWAVATITGTAALHLALAAVGIGYGDIVKIPSLTFIGTANAAIMAGVKDLLFADIEGSIENWCPDLHRLDSATACVIDAAPAIGMDLSEHRICSLSFNGNKVITTGQGGAVVGMEDKDEERVREIINLCRKDRETYECCGIGYNYAMPNINAALGMGQIKFLGGILEERKYIRERYAQHMTMLPSQWACVVVLPKNNNVEVSSMLRQSGISARPFWHPLSTMSHLRLYTYYRSEACPRAEKDHGRLMMIPCYLGLTNRQQDRIIEECKKYL
jgi:perosamine synthetase